jgi:thiol-disulfide isomerase/thioredoxin
MTEARTLAVGVAGVLYVTGAASIKPDDGSPKPVAQKEVEVFAKGQLARLETPPARRPAPSTSFTGPDGAPVKLSGFEGQVTVVNLWATWCPPCVTEMPSLARLQQAYPNGAVRVAAVSIDGPNKLDAAKAFIGQNAPLEFYHSPEAALAWALEAKGFPTTVILDKQGFERARLSRPAEWDSPEVRALLDRLAADPA